MHIIDTKGFLCPKPLIMAKRAMKEMQKGTTFTVISDNDVTNDNLMSFLTDLGANPSLTLENGICSIIATVPEKEKEVKVAEDYCPIPVKNNLSDSVICIKSSYMGEGDPELGTILMRAFINTIKELDKTPSTLIFYNEAVKFVTEGSDVIPAIKELESKGIKIIVCGTCVDFYELKSKVEVGIISNMYIIAETLSNATNVIYP
ncbi:MAG: sulfurtransferase-like selenium metabolism protein YedF [Bacteroidota bacterium]|nr:sulfurtransferase-like selenium metabolism protein YedF [Bacteroidota bacterium]